MSQPVARSHAGATALAVAGVMFVLYPVVRPWHDETTVSGAVASMASTAWVWSHLFAMVGFVLVGLGLLALRRLLDGTPGAGAGRVGVVLGWIGAGLTLPYYGAEDFGLHALSRAAAAGARVDLLAVVQDVRYNPVAVTTFALGLLLLGAGAVVAAVGVRRSGVLPPASAVVFALGLALFVPQFYGSPAVRIGHGVVTGVGCVWLAVGLARGTGGDRLTPPASARAS